MKDTLFERIYKKYGLAIGKDLYRNQIAMLENAFNSIEAGEEVTIEDPFVQVCFDLIVCDIKHTQRTKKEG